MTNKMFLIFYPHDEESIHFKITLTEEEAIIEVAKFAFRMLKKNSTRMLKINSTEVEHKIYHRPKMFSFHKKMRML